MPKKTDTEGFVEAKDLDPALQKVKANAAEGERGTRSDAFDKAQQNLDQYLTEFQSLADQRTQPGGLTSIDVQCDSIDDEPMIGLDGWGAYKIHENANVSFLRAWREWTRGKPTNSGSVEFLSQEDRVLWHLAELPIGQAPTEKGERRETESALIRWSFDDSRYEYDQQGNVSVWPDLDEFGKPHKNAGEAIRMWRLQEIRKVQADATDEITSAMMDVRRAQSKVRKERNADFTERSIEIPGEMSEVSF